MNINLQNSLLYFGALGIITGMGSCTATPEHTETKPNIIYILADDLGYGELGVYGQTKIETPHIDQLAKEGMLFTQHYTGAPVCAPARSILLTGMHSGKSQVRGNDPMPERGDVQNYLAMFADSTLEGSYPISDDTYTIGKMLQTAGYKTAVVGKWGLGIPGTGGLPNTVGFDFFYGYICQRQAHTFYPLHLWKNENRVYLNNDTVAPHISLAKDADPYDLKNYEPFTLNDYSADLMFVELTNFVNENKSNPFFLYWATPLIHLPLQAPKEWVDYYVNKFGDEEPYPGTPDRGGYFPVRYPKATYAAMLSYFDDQVGKLVLQLKELGLYENTIIMFSSDNGPIGSYTPWFESAAPFRTEAGYIKGELNEGGIRVPMIVSWPGKINAGSVSHHMSAFYDVMPTLAEISGADTPADIDGISFLPTLLDKEQTKHEFLYWEYPASGGQLAVRIGNLKALIKNLNNSSELNWKVYDLENDPEERNDISASQPDFIKKVNEIVKQEHTVSPNKRWQHKVLGD
jgi:arylsulfatase A-like enzyme